MNLEELKQTYNWIRVEPHHGNDIICGGILPVDVIEAGQRWQETGGGVVTVTSVRGDIVRYYWLKDGERVHGDKSDFAFQCGYCLIV